MKANKLRKAGFLIILMGAFLFTLTTCKKKEEEPPPVTDEFVIAPTAKFIVDNDWQSMLENIDSADYTLTFKKEVLNTYVFAQGDLMVSSVGNGLLRKIETITQSGNDVIIQTSQATLVDLIQQGDIDYQGALTISQIKSITYYYPGVYLDTVNGKSTDGTLFNWNIDTEIYPQIRLQGNFQYTSKFIFQIQISILQGLKKVKFGFEGNEEFNLALISGNQFTLNKQITFATVYFAPFVIPLPVPPFAIVIVPVLDIKLGVDGYANANLSTTLTQSFTIETGLQYLKEEGWSSYANYDKSFNYTPPQLTVNAGAEAYVKPELSMLIFNLVGPYVNGKGYGKIEADLTQNPWWKMYYGFKMGAGVKAEIFGEVLFDYSNDDLINWEQQVGQATSGTPPTITTATITNITETTATGGGNITAQGSSSVNDRGVCWSTSQNPTTSDAKTTDGSGTGSFTSNLTGLTANTPYYVRAYATNSAGTAYGNQVSFTTTGGGPGGEPCPGIPTVTYGGQVYHTILIGGQCWFKENLNIGTRMNGSQNQTNNGVIEKYCYDDNETNCNTYGGLYQWDELLQYVTTEGAKGLCPDGWHIPMYAEWSTLTTYLGGESIAGGKMKSTSGWYNNGNGTNSSGFTALPSGNRKYSGYFGNLALTAYFWSSSQGDATSAWDQVLGSNGEGVYGGYLFKTYGLSARCVQD